MEQNCQTEKVFKEACKYIIDNRYRNLSQVEKEIIKAAIEESNTFDELLFTAFSAIALENDNRRL